MILPTHKRAREDTGKSEPASVLQAMDEVRKEGGKTSRD
jgi:hypothetical protein